jgi:hypothetical protein
LEHLQKVEEEDPIRLLAHAYTQQMALLAGGQRISKLISSTLPAVDGKEGISVFEFNVGCHFTVKQLQWHSILLFEKPKDYENSDPAMLRQQEPSEELKAQYRDAMNTAAATWSEEDAKKVFMTPFNHVHQILDLCDVHTSLPGRAGVGLNNLGSNNVDTWFISSVAKFRLSLH